VSLTVRIFFISFIALVIVASASRETLLWGASSWRSVSLTAATVLAAALLVLLAGRIRNGLGKMLEIPGRFSRKASVAAAAAAFVAMWILRSRHFLWGDGYSMGYAVERGITVLPSAPLATAISRGFFELVNRLLFWNSFETSALLSIIAGFLFAASVRASLGTNGGTETGNGDPARSSFPGAALAVAGGYFAVFFGLGGAAPLAAAGTGLFIWLSIVRLRGGAIPLIVPALAAMLAIMLGVSNIFLVVPLLYLLISAAASRGSRLEAVATTATVAACWIAADLASSRLPGFGGISSHLADAASRAFTSLSSAGTGGTLLLAFNSLVLAGPAALLAVILAATGTAKRRTAAGGGTGAPVPGSPVMFFLRVTAAAAAVFILLTAPRVQGGLRWEIIVPAAAAMAVYAAAALRGRSANAREFSASAILIVALGVYHLIPVVATDFSLDAGEKRILDLPLPAGRAATIIGAQAWHSKDYEKASEWWTKASGEDPGDADIWYRLGTARMKLEDPLEAISDFFKASQIEPGNEDYRKALAEAYIEQRWFTEASQELDALLSVYPDSARLWTRLGYACNHGNMYARAVDAYERALELDPENQEYVTNLTSAVLNRGAELQENGDFEGARKMYQYANRLYPADWVSLNNIATLDMEQGEWEKARRILAAALKEHDDIPQLHFNMSVVLENLGDYNAALEHLREAAILDRFNPPSDEHIERLMKKAGVDWPGE
jgi:tetratricopeptide (TPR) repeat protein